MTDRRRNEKVVYINRALLVYCLFAVGVWLVGFPVLMALQTNFSAWLNYAVLGALLVPVVALLLVLGRVAAWVILYAYWPIQAAVATVAVFMLAAVVVIYHADPPLILNGFDRPVLTGAVNVPELMRVEPGRIPTSVFGAAVVLLALTLILTAFWRVYTRSRQQPERSDSLPVVQHSELPAPKSLTYLQHRRRDQKP